jgi:SnoaL-like domain
MEEQMGLEFDRASATEAIRRIILLYPECIDRGNIDGVVDLLAGVKMCNSNGILASEVAEEDIPTLSAEDVRKMYTSSVIFYDDGLPHTKHVITNIDVWFSEDGQKAGSRSFYVVLQGLEDFPLQVIITGRYEDTFEFDGSHWQLRIRREYADLVGDLSRHVSAETLAQLTAH